MQEDAVTVPPGSSRPRLAHGPCTAHHTLVLATAARSAIVWARQISFSHAWGVTAPICRLGNSRTGKRDEPTVLGEYSERFATIRDG